MRRTASTINNSGRLCRRMLPKNKLAYKMLSKLKVYPGDQHPHQAQDPQPKEVGVK